MYHISAWLFVIFNIIILNVKRDLFFAWQFFVTHALFKFFLHKLIVGFTLEAKVVSSKHLTQVHLEITLS